MVDEMDGLLIVKNDSVTAVHDFSDVHSIKNCLIRLRHSIRLGKPCSKQSNYEFSLIRSVNHLILRITAFDKLRLLNPLRSRVSIPMAY